MRHVLANFNRKSAAIETAGAGISSARVRLPLYNALNNKGVRNDN